MLISPFEMSMMRKLSFFIFILCLLISFKNQNAETKKGWSSRISIKMPSSYTDTSSYFPDVFSTQAVYLSNEDDAENSPAADSPPESLEYDYYRKSCPGAEKTIRAILQELYKIRPSVAPALLRLVFHDCFIEGCDASVLLDPAEGIDSEKDSPPNRSLKAFDIVDIIKSELEEMCPSVVSCADILVLAAREGIVQAGGPYYPLNTGRRDSVVAFSDIATYELPSPHAVLSETLASFASRGFDERETVSLLGAHSIGVIHCRFFKNRLYNFAGTGEPDPSIDPELLTSLRIRCGPNDSPSSSAPSPSLTDSTSTPPPPPHLDLPTSIAATPHHSFDTSLSSSVSSSEAPSPSDNFISSSHREPEDDMSYAEPGEEFGTLYYRSLLQRKGLLYADQQLMAGEETGIWVRAFASDASLFRRDFALAMVKLSNLQVLTTPRGQIRTNCSRVAV